MPEPAETPPRRDWAKLWSIGALHMGQYFPAAFTAVALPAIFRQHGLPLESFWILSLPLAPNWMKWLMALAVDSYSHPRLGHRKSWILPCTAIGASLYVAAGFIPPTTATVYAIVAILTIKGFVMGAQDIAVDGLAAESMSPAERPVGTSIVVYLALLGGVLGQSCMALVETLGWQWTMTLASVLLIGAAAPALARPEPPPPEAARERRARGERPSLARALRRSDSRWIMPYMVAFGFAGRFIAALFPAFLVDKGLSLTQIGIVIPMATVVGWSGGGVLAPLLIRRLGLRRTAAAGAAVYLVYGPALAWLALRPGTPVLWAVLAILGGGGFGTSLYHYSVNNSRYRWCSKEQAGTDYSLQSSFWNLGVWLAASLCGPAAALVGYPAFMLVGTGASFLIGVWYVTMFDHVETLVTEREAATETAGAVSG